MNADFWVELTDGPLDGLRIRWEPGRAAVSVGHKHGEAIYRLEEEPIVRPDGLKRAWWQREVAVG